MLQLLLRRWWVVLLQGILLILLAIYIFKNPVTALAAVSIWFGVSVLLSGILGVLAWVGADKSERSGMSLIWNLLTAVLGLLMLMHVLVTMAAVSMIFGLWMILTGLHLVQIGWAERKNHSFGWLILIAGVLAALTGFPMLFNISTGAVGVSTLLGVLILLTGISLVLFAFVKKNVAGRIKDKVEDLRARMS